MNKSELQTCTNIHEYIRSKFPEYELGYLRNAHDQFNPLLKKLEELERARSHVLTIVDDLRSNYRL